MMYKIVLILKHVEIIKKYIGTYCFETKDNYNTENYVQSIICKI